MKFLITLGPGYNRFGFNIVMLELSIFYHGIYNEITVKHV